MMYMTRILVGARLFCMDAKGNGKAWLCGWLNEASWTGWYSAKGLAGALRWGISRHWNKVRGVAKGNVVLVLVMDAKWRSWGLFNRYPTHALARPCPSPFDVVTDEAVNALVWQVGRRDLSHGESARRALSRPVMASGKWPASEGRGWTG